MRKAGAGRKSEFEVIRKTVRTHFFKIRRKEWADEELSHRAGLRSGCTHCLGSRSSISSSMRSCLSYTLCFSAGAMIFVVVEALIPKSQGNEKNIDTVTNATLEGFGVMMMILDVGLG